MRHRFAVFAVLVLVAFSASAQMGRTHPTMPPMSGGGMGQDNAIMNGAKAGAMVSGTVATVGATSLTIASGLVTIDATGATIVAGNVKSATLASVKVGDLVVAMLKTDDVLPGAALSATIITVAPQAAVSLSGVVQKVEASSITILGQTVTVGTNTVFGGPRGQRSLADIAVGAQAMVAANVVESKLLATTIMVVGPKEQGPTTGHPTTLLRGTVKSIAADRWVITQTSDAKDVEVLVNTQTKIVGDPKVGDKVDVMATTDANGATVAISIMKSLK